MTPERLMQRMRDYGADIPGINDRFMGDAALYAQCFADFVEEPNFARLNAALSRGDREEAFAAAHAIKGIAMNLGVTPFCTALCTLVEALRPRDGRDVQREYAAMLQEYARLKALYADDAPDAPAETKQADKPQDGAAERRDKRKRGDLWLIAGLVAVGAALCYLLVRMMRG